VLLAAPEVAAAALEVEDDEDPHALTPTAKALVRMHEASARRTHKDAVISGDS
jgi:hypothetical protein